MSIEAVLIGVIVFFLTAAVVVVQWEKSEKRRNNASVIEEAIEVFGDSEKAMSWMNRTNLVLGKTPLLMLDTKAGANEVRKVLSSISTGGVA